MSTTIPALSSVTDILDSDLVMITHSSGESFKISGAEINKRNQAVIADSTTLTGAPLKTGNIVRVYFTADINGTNTSTGLTLNYNGVNKSVKVPKNGTLANFVASDLGGSPTVYKYLQAHTTLELLYDGTQFIIIGNPVVLSSSDYTIYADGKNKPDITTGTFTINMPRSTIQSQSGSYIKIGKVVYASVTLKISETLNLNDYFTISSNMPPVNVNKEAFGVWHSFSSNGYGNVQNSNNNSFWFIYNNAEYNVGQKVLDDGGNLMLSIIYVTN